MSDEIQEVKEETFDEKYDKALKLNEELKVNLKRAEELANRKLFGGDTDNVSEPVKPKEETPAEYKKRIMGY